MKAGIADLSRLGRLGRLLNISLTPIMKYKLFHGKKNRRIQGLKMSRCWIGRYYVISHARISQKGKIEVLTVKFNLTSLVGGFHINETS